MNQKDFDLILENEIQRTRKVLNAKAQEYADGGDRMHNFHTAAALDDETPEQALWGFLKKHIISLADMIKSGESQPLEKWDEKLGDFINYGFLLKALVIDTLPEDEKAAYLAGLKTKKSTNIVINHTNPGPPPNPQLIEEALKNSKHANRTL